MLFGQVLAEARDSRASDHDRASELWPPEIHARMATSQLSSVRRFVVGVGLRGRHRREGGKEQEERVKRDQNGGIDMATSVRSGGRRHSFKVGGPAGTEGKQTRSKTAERAPSKQQAMEASHGAGAGHPSLSNPDKAQQS